MAGTLQDAFPLPLIPWIEEGGRVYFLMCYDMIFVMASPFQVKWEEYRSPLCLFYYLINTIAACFGWYDPSSPSTKGLHGLLPVWPDKNDQMSIKLAKNDFTRRMIDFDTFTKIP